MTQAAPPFRADHVGSLLRPPQLQALRERFLQGGATAAELHAMEDRCIREVIALQESIGLHAITDGEFRRTSFHADFIEKLDGARSSGRLALPSEPGGAEAQGELGRTFAPRAFQITGKLRHARPIESDSFKFLRANTARTPKQTIPSPTMLLRGGRAAVSTEAYPDLAEFRSDIAKVFQAELRQLGEAGCSYVQLDDTNYAYLCDARLREAHRRAGDDPDSMPQRYADLINATLSGRPQGTAIAIHLCRGNSGGQWVAQGGYEPIAESLFNQLDVDAYFLEFDDVRSGGFEPLRFFPRQTRKKIVLGLVSTKTARVESKDEIKRRIDEAARYVPLERLCLSPQCGFASTFRGNPLPAEAQRRKLELIVEVAAEVWGTAG